MDTRTSPTRLPGFDRLRRAMVVCVVALHAAMTYMAYVPQWWYVIDSRQSPTYTLLVLALDTFPMTVLFFIAGFFTPFSLNKDKPSRFIGKKTVRLGIPWLLGMLLVTPALALATMRAFGVVPDGVAGFATEFLTGPFFQQGPYWFLSLLLCFMVCFALLEAAAGGGRVDRRRENQDRPKVRHIAVVIAMTAAAHTLSTHFVMPTDDWLSVGRVLYFQPARLTGYALAFAAGAHGFRQGWFSPSGWRPNVAYWGAISLLAMAARLSWFSAQLLDAPPPAINPQAHPAIDAITYSIAAVAMTLFLTGLYVRPDTTGARASGESAPASSMGIYWLHMAVLLPLQYLFTRVMLPTAILWSASLVLTIAICSILTHHMLQKIPFIGKLF